MFGWVSICHKYYLLVLHYIFGEYEVQKRNFLVFTGGCVCPKLILSSSFWNLFLTHDR